VENGLAPTTTTASNEGADIPNLGPRGYFKADQLKPWPHATNDSRREHLDDMDESEQTVWDEVFPQQLHYVLTTYLDEETHDSQIVLDLPWFHEGTQQRIDSAWGKNAKFFHAVLVGLECFLVAKAWRERGQIRGLGDKWYDEVIIMICRCISTRPYQFFQVHLKALYSSILVIPKDADARETCEYNLWQAETRNFDDRPFISHATLSRIFTKTNVRRILFDEKANFPFAEHRAWELLCNLAGTSAKQVFAICIYSGISLPSMYKFIVEYGVSDNELPLKRESHSAHQSGHSARNFARLVDAQSKFLVHDFKDYKSTLIVNVHKGIVVPVMSHTDTDLIGEGGFSLVYQVRVHQDYHDFTDVSLPAKCCVLPDKKFRIAKNFSH